MRRTREAGNCAKHPGNLHRDLLRKCAKGNPWPRLYYADIPVRSKRTGEFAVVRHPFQLPHEWLTQLLCRSEWQGDLRVQVCSPGIFEHVHKMAEQLAVDPKRVVALGFHGDGAPIGGTLNADSLEVFSMNLPSSRSASDLRVPITVVQRSHMVKGDTMAAIMRVLCWSLRCLAKIGRASCRERV